MNKVDKEIEQLRARLSELQRSKHRTKLQAKPKSTKPKGRPRIDAAIITRARLLAMDYPIPDVALTLGIGLKTLYRYGIKRYKLDAEKARMMR